MDFVYSVCGGDWSQKKDPAFDDRALETIEAALTRAALHPCALSDLRRLGWVPPLAGGAFVHAVNRQWLIALGR